MTGSKVEFKGDNLLTVQNLAGARMVEGSSTLATPDFKPFAQLGSGEKIATPDFRPLAQLITEKALGEGKTPLEMLTTMMKKVELTNNSSVRDTKSSPDKGVAV